MFVFAVFNLGAQEMLAPLGSNRALMALSGASNAHYLSKTTTANDTIILPFFEDFSYASESPYPSSLYWTDSSAYVNTGFAIAPPSIGVATFDGLNKLGYPYNINATNNISAAADYLTSKPLNLHTNGTKIYTPADSIAFSFLYQSAGFGDNPESSDSLVLEFYKPLKASSSLTNAPLGSWTYAWGTRGVITPKAMDSTFKKALIFITDTAYFHPGFKFRFRNKATTSGSLDHWHVDYVYMDELRSKISDTTSAIYDDVAFAYVPRPMLKNYTAMPYRQYTAAEMGHHFSNFLRYNTYGSNQHYNEYKFTVFNPNGTVLFTRDKGTRNISPFKITGYQKDTVHSHPFVDTLFPLMTAPTTYKIKHIINPADVCKSNDTVVQYQVFDNYYAYDDGSAEAGYYLNNAPGGKIALRYTLSTEDTLRAMDIFFDPVVNSYSISSVGFRMCVWAEGGGIPGNLILKDSVSFGVYLQQGYNAIPRYALTSPLILSAGTYYFGLQQRGNVQLNIGFDRNIDHKNALFFDTQGYWQPSTINGSLMLRPVFGGPAAAVGVQEIKNEKESLFRIYPNPANDMLYAKFLNDSKENSTLEIYSSLGQMVTSVKTENTITEIPVAQLSSGIYFVMLKQEGTVLAQQKLIISR